MRSMSHTRWCRNQDLHSDHLCTIIESRSEMVEVLFPKARRTVAGCVFPTGLSWVHRIQMGRTTFGLGPDGSEQESIFIHPYATQTLWNHTCVRLLTADLTRML